MNLKDHHAALKRLDEKRTQGKWRTDTRKPNVVMYEHGGIDSIGCDYKDSFVCQVSNMEQCWDNGAFVASAPLIMATLDEAMRRLEVVREALERALNSDMAMREEDEGVESKELNEIREALAEISKPWEGK